MKTQMHSHLPGYIFDYSGFEYPRQVEWMNEGEKEYFQRQRLLWSTKSKGKKKRRQKVVWARRKKVNLLVAAVFTEQKQACWTDAGYCSRNGMFVAVSLEVLWWDQRRAWPGGYGDETVKEKELNWHQGRQQGSKARNMSPYLNNNCTARNCLI